jgi:hypothetical protein
VKIISTVAIALLMFAMLMLGSTESLSQDTCAGSSIHTIQVQPTADDVPELRYTGGSAEEVHVCIGDTIKWVLTGPDRTYFVDFFEGAPFEGTERRGSDGNVVQVTVGGPAEPGSSYDYDVEFEDGGTLDPRIVVDR